MKLVKAWTNVIAKFKSQQVAIHEKYYASLAAFVAILILVKVVNFATFGGTFSLLVLGSMGASAFLLFVIPHSPMSQPWAVIGGHFVSSVIGVACAHWISSPPLATAIAVALSIYAMHSLQCLHPPSAATTMIAVLGGPEIYSMGWQFCYEVVVVNAGTMVLLSLIINNLIPGRRYPLLHSHHPHHESFSQTNLQPYPQLNETDYAWALTQMDGVIDVSSEDLVDLYEFAAEHAKNRATIVKYSVK
jgi:CBS-domain-containing membrane protein